jgi:hypothetical protein
VDFNNDGKKDIVAGDTKGQVWIFLNTGTDAAPVLAAGVLVEAGGEPIVGTSPKYEKDEDGQYRFVKVEDKIIGVYSKLHFADFNGDGLRDLLIGQDGPGDHDVLFYKNVGKADAPKFAKPVPLELPEPKMSRCSPYVYDLDGDGKVDLLFGTERAVVYYFRNVGSNENPKLEEGKKLALAGEGFDKSYRCRIDVADWNNDGKSDIVVGNFYSNVKPSGGNVWVFLRE